MPITYHIGESARKDTRKKDVTNEKQNNNAEKSLTVFKNQDK